MGVFRDAMVREMCVHGFSLRTQETYAAWMARLVRFSKVPANEVSQEHVHEFLVDMTQTRHLSSSSVNQAVGAVRFFYRHVVPRDWPLQFGYQREPSRLPVTLSREEVDRLLAAAGSLKQRALMELAYGGGLRLSEALHLKQADIDSQQMLIRIYRGKGEKDRDVMLSESLLETLREYWRKERPRRPWLFPSPVREGPIHETLVQRGFKFAKLQARIEKPATFHTLRHSFATHLMESGVSIRVIQRLLGHHSVKTTEVYTHVAGDYLKQTRSPLDCPPDGKRKRKRK